MFFTLTPAQPLLRLLVAKSGLEVIIIALSGKAIRHSDESVRGFPPLLLDLTLIRGVIAIPLNNRLLIVTIMTLVHIIIIVITVSVVTG